MRAANWIPIVSAVLAVGCEVGEAAPPTNVVAREVDCGTAAASLTVDIVDFAFRPAEISVRAGDVVKWTNDGKVMHTVTSGKPGSDDAGDVFDSGDLRTGDSFCLEFEGSGRATYFCEIHPLVMRGGVVDVAPAD